MECIVCETPFSLGRTVEMSSLVSSDCRPVNAKLSIVECAHCGHVQKVVDDYWQSVCDDIYSNYQIYHQADGGEQKSLSVSGDVFEARSELITRFLLSEVGCPGVGSIIDIGCGNGSFLKSFAAALPAWDINGAELNSTFEDDILNICDSARFWRLSDFESSDEKFNLISLIHCLEHISSPKAYLEGLHCRLAESGVLFVQVPDAMLNVFDLCIADHASHFSEASLRHLLECAGFEVVACGNLVLNKEITIVARSAVSKGSNVPPVPQSRLCEQLEYLNKLDKKVIEYSSGGKLGIFGSSIAASWLASRHGELVSFFVDEDQDRQGRTHMNRPILAPQEVPPDALVLVALAPVLAGQILRRLSGVGGVYVMAS